MGWPDCRVTRLWWVGAGLGSRVERERLGAGAAPSPEPGLLAGGLPLVSTWGNPPEALCPRPQPCSPSAQGGAPRCLTALWWGGQGSAARAAWSQAPGTLLG